VTVADFLARQGAVAERQGRWQLAAPIEDIERSVPESLRQMIAQQIDRLEPEERRTLEAASVAGAEFATPAVAAALEADALAVEDICETLARRGQFLAPAEARDLPDGAPLGRYEFTHVLYQHVLYDRVPPARRARLHRGVGTWTENAFGASATDVAAELAVHFEQAREERRAIGHLRNAAENDLRRQANREALVHLERTLRLLDRLPADEATTLYPMVREHVGLVRRAMGDMAGAVADFTALASWAGERCDVGWEAKALLYLASARSWVDPARARAASDRALALSDAIADPVIRADVRGYAAYWNLIVHGWRSEDARACPRRWRRCGRRATSCASASTSRGCRPSSARMATTAPPARPPRKDLRSPTRPGTRTTTCPVSTSGHGRSSCWVTGARCWRRCAMRSRGRSATGIRAGRSSFA